jgi:hypothetical protein
MTDLVIIKKYFQKKTIECPTWLIAVFASLLFPLADFLVHAKEARP